MLVGCSDCRAFSFNAWLTRVWYSPLNAYFKCVWSRSIFDGTESSVLVGVYSGLPIAAGWGVCLSVVSQWFRIALCRCFVVSLRYMPWCAMSAKLVCMKFMCNVVGVPAVVLVCRISAVCELVFRCTSISLASACIVVRTNVFMLCPWFVVDR